MLHSIHIPTLALCSMLASMAFGLVFASLWLGRRADDHFGWWSASSLVYAATLLFFQAGSDVPPSLGTLLYVLLGLSDVLLVAGVRSLDGAGAVRGWMAIPIVATALGHAVPRALAGVGLAAPALAAVGETGGLMIAMGLSGGAILRGGRGRRFSPGRTLAGVALLAYIPGYVAALVGRLTSDPADNLLALLPMLSDQLLLGMLNLGLLAMPVERAHERLRDAALRDPLTGAWNRAGLAAGASAWLAEGAAIVAMDVDHFKAINDRHGHAGGDAVLVALACRTRRLLAEQGGELARIGGDEFVAVLPGCSLAGARCFAARLRHWPEPGDGPAGWTTSMGISLAAPGESVDAALKRADGSLYVAKSAGRDRVAA